MKSKGFTLIELLVVITIIAILSLIGLVTYSNIQQNARDSKRKLDIDAIAKALESNYTTNSATPYPAVAGSMFVGGTIPTNPSTGGVAYVYPTVASSSWTVCASLEKSTGNATDTGGTGYDTNKTNGAAYCVKSSQN
mgnify:CR=1 FL=1